MVDLVGAFQQGRQDVRQNRAYDALREQYGDIAGDPFTANVLAGNERRQQQFDANMADRDRQVYLQALQNGANMYRQAIGRGATPEQATRLIAPALPRLFGNEEDANEAAMMLSSDPNAAEAIFSGLAGEASPQQMQPQPRGAPFVARDDAGRPVFAQQIVGPDGSVSVQTLEGVAPPIRQDTRRNRQYRTLPQEEVTALGFPEGSVIQQTDEGQLVEVRTPARERAQQEDGRERVTGTLQRAVQLYVDLERLRGVPTPEGGATQNLAAVVARGTPGADTVLGALGNESARRAQELEGIRPQILSAVAQATGMSSRQMDSNRELQFYLQAATNPTQDVVANYGALYALARNFGNLEEVERVIPENRLEEVRRRAAAIEEQAPSVEDRAALLGVTMDDIQFAAEEENISVDEVLMLLEEAQ